MWGWGLWEVSIVIVGVDLIDGDIGHGVVIFSIGQSSINIA